MLHKKMLISEPLVRIVSLLERVS